MPLGATPRGRYMPTPGGRITPTPDTFSGASISARHTTMFSVPAGVSHRAVSESPSAIPITTHMSATATGMARFSARYMGLRSPADSAGKTRAADTAIWVILRL